MENKKEQYAIRSTDGQAIPLTNLAAIFIDDSDYIGTVTIKALVFPEDDMAYTYFNPRRTQYPQYLNPPKGRDEEILIKVLKYDWQNAPDLKEKIEHLDPDNPDPDISNRDLIALDSIVSMWAEKKAKKEVLAFNQKIAEKLPSITKYKYIEF